MPCLNAPRVSQVLSALLRYQDFISISDEVVINYGFGLQVLEDAPHLFDLSECLILFNFCSHLNSCRCLNLWLSNKLFRLGLATYSWNSFTSLYHFSELRWIILRRIRSLHLFNFLWHLSSHRSSRSCSW